MGGFWRERREGFNGSGGVAKGDRSGEIGHREM